MIKPIKYYITNYYKQYRDAVDDILMNLDYKKIHKVMKYLDWGWRDEGIPEIYDIKNAIAEELLKVEDRVREDQTEYRSSCGGIEIECRSYDFEELRKIQGQDVQDDFDGCVYLNCMFILDEWDNAI